MSILSLYFPVFVIVFIGAYFIVPDTKQWYVILLGSIVFYLFSGPGPFLIVLLSAVLSYIAALKIQKIADTYDQRIASCTDSTEKKELKKKAGSEKKRIVYVLVFILLALLIVLKKGCADEFFSLEEGTTLVPLGLSFYTLNIISYLIDCERGKCEAEKNILKYLTYVLFFPHIIQGPFSKYGELSKELFVGHSFSYERMTKGLSRILYGYFKKAVIADRLSPVVNTVLLEHASYHGFAIFMTLILYSIQLYCDFSAYMDIMCGICEILGIHLKENFAQPYFSKSLDEFWRRWHISLGEWFRDYVFYPVSVSKKVQGLAKKVRARFGNKAGKLFAGYAALFCVWTLTGLWHDLTWNYLVWGYLNMLGIGLAMGFADQFKEMREKRKIDSSGKTWQIFSMIRVFLLVCLIRAVSITPDLNTAMKVYAGLFRMTGNGISTAFEGWGIIGILILIIAVLTVLVIDILKETKKWDEARTSCPMMVREFLYALMIIAVILYIGAGNDLLGGFLYARF